MNLTNSNDQAFLKFQALQLFTWLKWQIYCKQQMLLTTVNWMIISSIHFPTRSTGWWLSQSFLRNMTFQLHLKGSEFSILRLLAYECPQSMGCFRCFRGDQFQEMTSQKPMLLIAYGLLLIFVDTVEVYLSKPNLSETHMHNSKA